MTTIAARRVGGQLRPLLLTVAVGVAVVVGVEFACRCTRVHPTDAAAAQFFSILLFLIV